MSRRLRQRATVVLVRNGRVLLVGDATMLFYMTEEGKEGRDAFNERRKPDFRQFPWRP